VSRIFLSHSSKDARETRALKQWLVKQDYSLRADIFVDFDPEVGIPTGVRWREALQHASDRCEAVVCLLSQNWAHSSECRREYDTALQLNKRIFCARLEPSNADELTAQWQRCDLFGDGRVESVDIDDGGVSVIFAADGLRRLFTGIRGAGISAESFGWPPGEDPGRAPYRGWNPLTEADAAIFFGRDAEILRGLDALRGMRVAGIKHLFVVLGPSGAGKSSFLRAGLLPRLRRDDRNFLVLPLVRPERAAISGHGGLAASIHAARAQYGFHEPDIDDIAAMCPSDPLQMAGLLVDCQRVAMVRLLDERADASPPTIVLPLDQAEELFSADAGPQAKHFMRLISALVDTRLALIVAATIRTDSYESMQTAPEFADLQAVTFNDLKPMPRDHFKDVITGPAARSTGAGHRLTLDADLVAQLLADCTEGADTLPMLSLTLSRLYLDYGATGRLTLEQYTAMGGMSRVVETEIDSILSPDSTERAVQLQALRVAFIPWLATISPDNDQPIRRVARWTNLPLASRPLIDALVARRLVAKDTRDGEVVVEVGLESLLRQWAELASWLREQRHNLKAAQDLENVSAAWEANDRSPDWLLAGARLVDAEMLAGASGFGERLATARDYLVACREAENRRLQAEDEHRRAELQAAEEKARHAEERQATAEAHSADLHRRSRVLRIVLAATAVVAVIAVVVGVVAVVARRDAQGRFREATSLRLATDAQSMLARNRPGGDVRALQQITVAASLAPRAVYAALYEAVVKLATTRKIIDTPANSAAFDPGGHRLVTGGPDGTVALWNGDTGVPIGEPLTGHVDWITSVAFSPDGHRFATASRDNSARLWNADTGAPLGGPLNGHTGVVTSAALSAYLLATGSQDGTVRLWNRDTGAPVGQPLRGHTDWVTSVAFSPDGRLLASAGRDATVRLWYADNGTPAGEPLTRNTEAVTSVAFSGDRLAAGSADGTVQLWSTDTRAALGQPIRAHDGRVNGVAFSSDGRRLATAGADKTLRLWDAETGAPRGQPFTEHTDAVTSVTFSPDGHSLASTSADNTVRLWNADATVPLGQPLTGHTSAVTSVVFASQRLATGSEDGTARLWDIRTGVPLGRPLVGHIGAVRDVAFGADGHRLATAGADGTLRLWDTDTGTAVGGPLTTHSGPLTSVAFHGHRLATGGEDGTVLLWDADSRSLLSQPVKAHTDQVNSVTFSPDGRRLASAGADGTAKMWWADTGVPIGKALTGHADWVTDVAFSPDGHYLATASRDHTVRLWNGETGAPAGDPLVGHTYWVNSVAFNADGTLLASASSDGTARLWSADSRAPVGDALTGHTDELTSVAFSPDENLLATTSNDKTLRLWLALARPEDLCDKLALNMSRAQWKEWVSPAIPYVTACPGIPVAQD
jgi:WD40 repeat protein